MHIVCAITVKLLQSMFSDTFVSMTLFNFKGLINGIYHLFPKQLQNLQWKSYMVN